jgi:hypothetical protein
MNRSESTISRELRRNALPKGGYQTPAEAFLENLTIALEM